MIIEFDEPSHSYSVNGDIASVSITEMLSRHGLAPDYSGVSKSTLKVSAKKGKEIHKDLENIFKEPKYEPTTDEGKQFDKWVRDNIDCGTSEQLLGINYKSMLVGGTADLIAIMKDGSLMVGDHKTTSMFHREYVTWQVSLYDYALRKLGKESLNGKKFNWKGAKKFYCFQFHNGEFKVHELEKIPDEEIERLLECELNGEIYTKQVLVIAQELQEQVEKAEEEFSLIESQYKSAKDRVAETRDKIKKLFEEQGIKSWESPNSKVKVTYVAPSERLKVDSRMLKQEYPKVYESVVKVDKVNSYIKVSVKED